jgi:NAD(P)-dependent dehydrogenase (short-subunit alcohol dehydrogenase family)
LAQLQNFSSPSAIPRAAARNHSIKTLHLEETMMAAWQGVGGKRVLITGATNGIGLAAAGALAGLGAKLALVARDKQRAASAVELIKAVVGTATKVDVLAADLSSQQSIRRLAQQVLLRYPSLHVLVNNAGAIYETRQLSDDGIELTWAVNHLAPFLLTTLLLERLRRSAPARIINTASDGHVLCRGIPFADLNAEHSYWGFLRYCASKLANIMFTKELERRLRGTGVTANCFHPGVVATGINQNNSALQTMFMATIRPLLRTPQEGAKTLVWLAQSPEVSNMSGLYFADETPVPTSLAAQDLVAARRLWRISENSCQATLKHRDHRGHTRTHNLHLTA